MSPTIIIADDHPLFREALKLAISQTLTGAQTFEADTVDSLLAALHAHPEIDLLLLDLGMPGAHGFSALVQTRAHYPAVPVVVISGREDQDIAQRTLVHGAAAFIAKSAAVPTIIDALQTILRGGIWNPPETRLAASRANAVNPDEADAARRVASLTPQQFRVMSMLCSGQSNKRIALQLDVSEATVKAHMTAILEKMGAENRTQAVLIAQRLALHQFAPPAPEDET
ncbi:MAG TPA: response regulator transcription factor [Steroidobacteraceae bacterium]|jgi:DNA-binding NarL/FixJ family response regulator|nr:response regulator transcription factor [Steroidobacteraceae bacterium]